MLPLSSLILRDAVRSCDMLISQYPTCPAQTAVWSELPLIDNFLNTSIINYQDMNTWWSSVSDHYLSGLLLERCSSQQTLVTTGRPWRFAWHSIFLWDCRESCWNMSWEGRWETQPGQGDWGGIRVTLWCHSYWWAGSGSHLHSREENNVFKLWISLSLSLSFKYMQNLIGIINQLRKLLGSTAFEMEPV